MSRVRSDCTNRPNTCGSISGRIPRPLSCTRISTASPIEAARSEIDRHGFLAKSLPAIEAIRAGGVDPKDDNALAITTDGRRLALDPRLVTAEAHAPAEGKVARLSEQVLPGRDVLAEHLRLGSQAVILSRTFHRPDEPGSAAHPFEAEVAALRRAEAELSRRTATQVEQDRARIAAVIEGIGAAMARRAAEAAA